MRPEESGHLTPAEVESAGASDEPPVMRTPSQPAVLIVSDRCDGALEQMMRRVEEQGWRVVHVPDVYAAMARLARERSLRYVLLDVRPLDRHEAAFADLAPRYYPGIELIAPLLKGTAERLSEYLPRLRSATPEAIVEALSGEAVEPAVIGDSSVGPEQSAAGRDAERTAQTDEPSASNGDACQEMAAAESGRPATPEPPTAAAANAPLPAPAAIRLSTDGGPDEAHSGPALHEVVRMRMAGDDPRAVRRRPPSKSAPPQPTRSPGQTEPDRGSSLLREELDALLAEEPKAAPAMPFKPAGPSGGPA